MRRVVAPDGVWIVHEEDKNLTALDEGRLVLYPAEFPKKEEPKQPKQKGWLE